MSRTYMEVTVEAPVEGDELAGELADTGLLGATETCGAFQLYWPEEVWDPAVLDMLKKWLAVRGVPVADAAITVTSVADRDWNASWLESIQPIRVGRRLLIRQSWNAVEVPPGVTQLVVDPKRAFGSGYHATTQLLLEWLEDVVRGGERVLDVGTGSGILAMAALRWGAASALGIDNDPEAIECARENASANGFRQELELRVAPVEAIGAETFDIVLANLDRNTLLRLAGRLAAAAGKGGRMFLSGIQPEDFDDISRVLAVAGARVTCRRDRAGWLALEVHT